MLENENTDHSSLDSFNTLQNKNKINDIIMQNDKKKNGVIKEISNLLKDICEEGKSNKEDILLLIKPFVSKKIPSITINDYIERLLKYSKVSEDIFILALIYIDRICRNHKINLNYNNIHKLILASFIVTIKFHEDDYYSLTFYAKLGGIPKKEIVILEYEFLKLIDFDLFVETELFDKYNNNLKNLENDEDEDEDDFY